MMTLNQEITLLAYLIEAKKIRLLERILVLETSFESTSTNVPIIVGLIQNTKPIEYSVPTHYTPVFTNPTLV